MSGADFNARVTGRGNGLPDVGDYVAGKDGELYQVERISCIHCGDRAKGEDDYVYAVLSPADWDDIDSAEIHSASAELDQ